ncbi:hypothetical protein Golax_005380, partial [Gossypium laxum]|nr:hypothetical protein [Gossypium laxum]
MVLLKDLDCAICIKGCNTLNPSPSLEQDYEALSEFTDQIQLIHIIYYSYPKSIILFLKWAIEAQRSSCEPITGSSEEPLIGKLRIAIYQEVQDHNRSECSEELLTGSPQELYNGKLEKANNRMLFQAVFSGRYISMERDLAVLSLDDEEEEIMHIQKELDPGVQILDLGEKRFLFRFYYKMDLERVLKGSLWALNNHLLMLHHLRDGEDPLKEGSTKLFASKGSIGCEMTSEEKEE